MDKKVYSYNTAIPTGKIYYGICSSIANTYAKTATVEAFPLDKKKRPLAGIVIGIKFTMTNAYKKPGHVYSLNVNKTGAYPIYYNNTVLFTSTTANTLVAGYANRYVFYMFNGHQWVFLSASFDANNKYSNKTSTGNGYTKAEINSLLNTKANSADLANVATSGRYADLVGAPQYVLCTLSEYNGMMSHDSNTYYIIIADSNE